MKTKNIDQILIANNFFFLAISLCTPLIHSDNNEWNELTLILKGILFTFISMGIRYYYLAFKSYLPRIKTDVTHPFKGVTN